MAAETGSPCSIEARALWFPAARVAELRPETVPPPGPGEVRVKTAFSAVSHGTEMLIYRGRVFPELPLDLPTLEGSFAFPIKHGYAAAGRVLDVGEGVERLSPGDPVFVHHPHQEIFIVPEEMPARLPDGLDLLLGVFTANLETALNVVHDTPVRLGETALVSGQGAVGLLVSQLLVLAGAGRVLAADPLARRRELALAVGADEALEPGDDLPARVSGATGGRGADVAVEASGSGEALQGAIDSVAVEGTVVVASWYGARPVELTLGGHFHRGRVRLRSSQVGRINPELEPRWDHARRLGTAIGLLERMRLEEIVTHRITFDEAPAAYRMLDERPGEAVQVIFTYEGV